MEYRPATGLEEPPILSKSSHHRQLRTLIGTQSTESLFMRRQPILQQIDGKRILVRNGAVWRNGKRHFHS